MFISAEPPNGSIFYYYAYSKVNSKNRFKLTAVSWVTTSSEENRNCPPIKSFFLVAEVAASGKEEILWIVMS